MSHDIQTYTRVSRKARLETSNYRGTQKYKITDKHTKYRPTYRVEKSDAKASRVLLMIQSDSR